MVIKPGGSPQPDEWLGFEGGSGNSPFKMDWYWIGVDVMMEKIKDFFFVFIR